MINTSPQWQDAITGAVRRTRVKVPVRIIDSALTYDGVTSSDGAAFSQNNQVIDGDFDGAAQYATGETNRWLLNGETDFLTAQMGYDGQVGFVSTARSGTDGTFSNPPEIDVSISNVDTIRAVSIQFPTDEQDGYGVDFTVELSASGTALDAVTVTGNTNKKAAVTINGTGPDKITLTISKWSLPDRRARVVEIYPGYAVDWTEDSVLDLNIKRECSLSAMAQPYSTAVITVDNTEGIFNPLDKNSLFQAIEEGQAFPIEIGVDGAEYLPMGSYYHHNRGWSMGDEGLTFRFDLVDLIGLLADVDFVAPETLPTTAGGWLAEIVSQLGSGFVGHWAIEPSSLADLSLTATAEDVDGKGCSELIKQICQATGCIAMTRPSDGYLLLRSSFDLGASYDLDNLDKRPSFSANDYLSRIDFSFSTGDPVSFYGTDTGKNTTSINNPFVSTENAALNVAQRIFGAYGGNRISLTGRGNPATELGDLITVGLASGDDVSGRVLQQTFKYSNGVMSGCAVEMLHAQSNYMDSSNRVVFTQNGSWTVPENVSGISIILVGGGSGGGWGYKRFWEQFDTPDDAISAGWPLTLYNTHDLWANAADEWYYGFFTTGGTRSRLGAGEDGPGGKILVQTLSVTPGQTFMVTVGTGGDIGVGTLGDGKPPSAAPGTATTFGNYSSEQGAVYSNGYVDMHTGDVYGKPAKATVPANSGYGGQGGYGGYPAHSRVTHTNKKQWVYNYDINSYVEAYIPAEPYTWDRDYSLDRGGFRGGMGTRVTPVAGADGICLIYYDIDTEEES